MILIAIHLLAGVFWAGSTFTLALSGGRGADALFRPQMIAAVLAIVAGVILWAVVIRGSVGPMETSLSVGAACAVIAAGFQGAWRKQPALSQRIAAGLLAVTVVSMAIARYLG
jgi:hypothetical protein